MERVGANTATPFRVRFPDGAEYRNSDAAPAFTLLVRDERALRRAALYGHVGVLECRLSPALAPEAGHEPGIAAQVLVDVVSIAD